MARRTAMQRFARWHIWLGWAAALPLLVWTISGLVMTLRPIEDVRGTTLKIESPPRAVTVALNGGDQATMIAEGRILNQRGRSVLIATYLDGSTGRIELASGGSHPLPPADEAEARRTVAEGIKGGKSATSARLFDAANPPPDFGRKIAVWQVTLEDGTHVYVGRNTGEIEAVRTRWWRFYDVFWGLHIMDPVEREDTSHPLLWIFSVLALGSSLLGTVLLFRRRRALNR